MFCRPARRFLPLLASLALASGATTALAAPPSFVIHPYLQHLSPAEVTVRFELATDAPASVEVRSGNAPASRIESSSARFHSVTLRGLQPATSYTYSVRSGDLTSDAATFTTAHHDPDRSFSFVLYGDSRSGSTPHGAVARAIEASASDFLVGTGDVVVTGGDRNAWLEFFAIEQRLLSDRCLFSAIGNHELTFPLKSRGPWIDYFAVDRNDRSTSWFSFRWGNTRFLVLDAMGRWNDSQAEWLRAELTKADTEPGIAHRFVVMHHSPFSSGPHGPNRPFIEAGMVDELVRHKVELVMAGHDHIYERGEARGIKYIISGGAGAPLYAYKRGSGSLAGVSAYHFVDMHVDGDQVTAVARRADRSVIEEVSFRGTGAWQAPLAAAASTSAASPAASGPVVSAAGPDLPGSRQSRCGCSLPGSTGPWGPWLTLALPLAPLVRRRRNRRA